MDNTMKSEYYCGTQSDADSGYDDHGVITIPVVRTVVSSDENGRKISTTSSDWISIKKNGTSPLSVAMEPTITQGSPVKERRSSVTMSNNGSYNNRILSKQPDNEWDECHSSKERKNDMESDRSYRFLVRSPRFIFPKPMMRNISVSNKTHLKEETTRRIPRRKMRSKSADGRLTKKSLFSPTYSKILSPETMRRRKAVADILKIDCIIEEEYYKIPYEECNMEVINGRLSNSEMGLNFLRNRRDRTRKESDDQLNVEIRPSRKPRAFECKPPIIPRTSTSVTESLKNLIADIQLIDIPPINNNTEQRASLKLPIEQRFGEELNLSYEDDCLTNCVEQLSRGDICEIILSNEELSDDQSSFTSDQNSQNQEDDPPNPFKKYLLEDDEGLPDLKKPISSFNTLSNEDQSRATSSKQSDNLIQLSSDEKSTEDNSADEETKDCNISEYSIPRKPGRASSLKRGRKSPIKKTVSFSNETEELYYLSTPSDSDGSVFDDDPSSEEVDEDNAETIVVKSFQSELPMLAEIVHVNDINTYNVNENMKILQPIQFPIENQNTPKKFEVHLTSTEKLQDHQNNQKMPHDCQDNLSNRMEIKELYNNAKDINLPNHNDRKTQAKLQNHLGEKSKVDNHYKKLTTPQNYQENSTEFQIHPRKPIEQLENHRNREIENQNRISNRRKLQNHHINSAELHDQASKNFTLQNHQNSPIKHQNHHQSQTELQNRLRNIKKLQSNQLTSEKRKDNLSNTTKRRNQQNNPKESNSHHKIATDFQNRLDSAQNYHNHQNNKSELITHENSQNQSNYSTEVQDCLKNEQYQNRNQILFQNQKLIPIEIQDCPSNAINQAYKKEHLIAQEQYQKRFDSKNRNSESKNQQPNTKNEIPKTRKLSDEVDIRMTNGIDSTRHKIFFETKDLCRQPVVSVSRIRVPFSSIQDQWDWAAPYLLYHNKSFETLTKNFHNNINDLGSYLNHIPISTSKDSTHETCLSPIPSCNSSSSGCFSASCTPSPSLVKNKGVSLPTAL